MKKKILAGALLCAVLAVAAAGTVAYYTAEETAHNVITAGGVSIELVEQQAVTRPDGETALEPFPTAGVSVMPGMSASKIVSVKNTAPADTRGDAWVRVKLTATVVYAGQTQAQPADPNVISLVVSQDAALWQLGADGWYYYQKPLAPQAQTEALLSAVAFDGPAMGNEYQGADVQITVSAQAVQSANNGDTVSQAAGWPEE